MSDFVPLLNVQTIWIIGAGGVGSWLAPALAKLTHNTNSAVILVDADKLEEKNLDRQLFTHDDIGRYKAEALGERLGMGFRPHWFTRGSINTSMWDVLLVCVDNHAARKDALQQVDDYGGIAIIGANETTSAEAYVYRGEWKDTRLDPRVYYPEILTDTSGDPRAAAIGCTGQAQEQNPQLVTANFMAAALMQHLFIVWAYEYPKFEADAIAHLPHKLVSNLGRLTSDKVGVPAPQERTHAENSTVSATAAADYAPPF